VREIKQILCVGEAEIVGNLAEIGSPLILILADSLEKYGST
jgi:hypothetical protein